MERIILAIIKPFYWIVRVVLGNYFGLSLPPYEEYFVLRLFYFWGYKPTKRFIDMSEEYALEFYSPLRRQMLNFPAGSNKLIPTIPIIQASDLLAQALVLDFVDLGRTFKLRDEIRDLTDEALNNYLAELKTFKSKVFDFVNARLNNVRYLPDKIVLEIEGVSYYDYLRTNMCLDYSPKKDDLSLREKLNSGGVIEDLSGSVLGNNLGANVLLITPGGQAIIQKRSVSVVLRPGELAPSFSGTIEPTDVISRGGELGKLRLFREGVEELGIQEADIHTLDDGSNFRFLGVTRELVRGGQPEFFAVAFTRRTVAEIQERWQESRDKFESRQIRSFPLVDMLAKGEGDLVKSFKRNVRAFSSKNSRTISLPLKTNLALLDANWDAWFRDINLVVRNVPRLTIETDAKFRNVLMRK